MAGDTANEPAARGDLGTLRRDDFTPCPPDSVSPRPRVSSSPRPPVSLSPRRVSSSRRPRHALIALLTDFGTADYFVGAMKGAILSLNSRARIVDITHDVPPHDIHGGAFTLLAAYRTFPPGTIHVAVVDPGVGSSRRAIIVSTGDQLFVGPDNGIFSAVCERERGSRVFRITNEQYFNHPVSATFHGRDVFAPVAAALSLGIKPAQIGHQIDDHVRLEPFVAEKLKDGRIKASIIHIDHFGNCVTSLTPHDLTPLMIKKGARLDVNGRSITSFRQFFADQRSRRTKLFAVWGSAGFLEIAALNRSAAQALKAKRGQSVMVTVERD